jgi:hypothetical protein
MRKDSLVYYLSPREQLSNASQWSHIPAEALRDIDPNIACLWTQPTEDIHRVRCLRTGRSAAEFAVTAEPALLHCNMKLWMRRPPSGPSCGYSGALLVEGSRSRITCWE